MAKYPSAVAPRASAGPASRSGAVVALRVVAVRSVVAVLTLILGSAPCLAIDPHSPEVTQAIERGVTFLREHLDEMKSYEAGIVGYALIRSGEAVDSPDVKTTLRRILDDKFHGGTYNRETPHQFYEAGTEMMMLEAVSARRYQRELELIATFAVDNQWPSGSWYYYRQPEQGGDTSHTQYAILGLWAASRAGVRIPRGVWSRAAEWHIKNQLSDGGFAYHPGGIKDATHSMTANGVASLCIARLMLYPNRSYPPVFAPVKEDDDKEPASGDDKSTKATTREEVNAAEPKPPERPDVLQPLDLSSSRGLSRPRRSRIVSSAPAVKVVPLAKLNQAISRGANWIRINFAKPDRRFHVVLPLRARADVRARGRR